MPLAYVLDEHLRRRLWKAIQGHNAQSKDVLDVVRAGDPLDLPLGTLDPDLLLWMETQDRVLISLDRRTMPIHLSAHLNSAKVASRSDCRGVP